MGQRHLTPAEREQIYLKKECGQSLPEVAVELNISYACARQWWRRSRDEGLSGLRARKPGRKPTGILSDFDSRVVEKSLALKRSMCAGAPTGFWWNERAWLNWPS